MGSQDSIDTVVSVTVTLSDNQRDTVSSCLAQPSSVVPQQIPFNSLLAWCLGLALLSSYVVMPYINVFDWYFAWPPLVAFSCRWWGCSTVAGFRRCKFCFLMQHILLESPYLSCPVLCCLLLSAKLFLNIRHKVSLCSFGCPKLNL